MRKALVAAPLAFGLLFVTVAMGALATQAPAGSACQTGGPMVPVPHAGLLTQAQISALWVREGGPVNQAQIAGAVGMAESGGDPNATGPPTPHGVAIGIMQILGAVLPGDLHDPVVNMRNAIKKWRDAPGGGRNWSPWTTFTSGSYLKYMGNAQPVAAPVVCAPPVTAGGIVGRLQEFASWMDAQNYPYCWGGGHVQPAVPSHGQWCHGPSGITSDPSIIGLDCSGAVSMLFQHSGIPVVTLDSTGFMSFGDPGPGQHVTVYANAAHVFVVIDGRTFQTSVTNWRGGAGWTAARSSVGFVARHPPGL